MINDKAREIIDALESKFQVHIYEHGEKTLFQKYDVYFNGEKINPYPMSLADLEVMLYEM